MKKKSGILEPSVILKFKDLGFKNTPNLSNLVYRFERLELIYFALEIIYKRELSIGYENFCKRVYPQDNGKTIIEVLNKELAFSHIPLHAYHIVSAQTGLELLKYILSIPNDEIPWDFESIDDGANIKSNSVFAIILLINNRITKCEDTFSQKQNIDEVLAMVASTMVEYNDFTNFNLATTPLIHLYKASLFIDYCKNYPILNECISKFLSKYHCNDAKTYFASIAKLFCENLEYKDRYCLFKFDDISSVPKIFFDFSISINELVCIEDNDDYKCFRDRPLLRISEKEFVTICFSFLIDKFYNSLIFDVSRISDTEYSKVKNLISDFSESKLLFPLIRKCVEPNSPIHLSGYDCNKILKEGAPDYYVRNWREIYLIELKDYSFKADIKSSPNNNELYEYLYEQFVEKNNGRNGAIRQLANNISRIIHKDFVWDKKIDELKNIYPILVLGNSNYLTYGIPYILNIFFRKELKAKALNSETINDLIVIDIDTLILYNDYFSYKSCIFRNEIKNYLKFIRRNNLKSDKKRLDLSSYMQPFPIFLQTRKPISSSCLANKIKETELWKN